MNVINNIPTNWNYISLQEDIQPRYDAFATQFDDNQIVILGGAN